MARRFSIFFKTRSRRLRAVFEPVATFSMLAKAFGIVHFLTNFFQERMDLGKNEKHFSAASGLQKELFIESAMQHEGRSHIPIAAHLANPGIFLARKRSSPP